MHRKHTDLFEGACAVKQCIKSVLELCAMTNRQTDKHTDKHTEPIVIERRQSQFQPASAFRINSFVVFSFPNVLFLLHNKIRLFICF